MGGRDYCHAHGRNSGGKWDLGILGYFSLVFNRGISIICGTGRRERELRKFLRRRADGVENLGE
jgi:hypothetical protein